jgi:hypothetical protein
MMQILDQFRLRGIAQLLRYPGASSWSASVPNRPFKALNSFSLDKNAAQICLHIFPVSANVGCRWHGVLRRICEA